MSILVFGEGAPSRPLYHYIGQVSDLAHAIKIPLPVPFQVGYDGPTGPDKILAPTVTIDLADRPRLVSGRLTRIGWLSPADVFLLRNIAPHLFPPCLVRL